MSLCGMGAICVTLLRLLKSWQIHHFWDIPALIGASCGFGLGGMLKALLMLWLMHSLLMWCLSSSRGRPLPSCTFCTSTVGAMLQTSLGCISATIPMASISSVIYPPPGVPHGSALFRADPHYSARIRIILCGSALFRTDPQGMWINLSQIFYQCPKIL